MNREILCNGHSSCLNQNAISPNHEGLSLKIIQDGKSSERACTQAQKQGHCMGRNFSTVDGEKIGSNIASIEDDAIHNRAESQTNPLKYMAPCVHSRADSTPDNKTFFPSSQRKALSRKHKAKKSSQRISESKYSQNGKVTDYFPIRRSSRKSKSELKCEEKKHIDELITKGIENGMMVQYIEGKGRGVFATQNFQKGQYIVEYHGDLLPITDAKKREAMYAQNPETGCYMYYFQYLSKTYCVDATKETDRLGRLINHSKNGNCQTKLHDINGIPHLILVASRDIQEGEELLYDYGDRSKASIAAHPWLKD
ncbi:N-lysine methyltransferase KMT5A-A [Chanos chanos]|uniref:[histone H4]-lysine(20) N-methyltransferase n=1 Tax=Chanos chanos TaxID=29144 RepID=A0A6J2UZC9_CHACN|nr:N-lysine methyltransferase KMT5A-A-like [Chanos chanos]